MRLTEDVHESIVAVMLGQGHTAEGRNGSAPQAAPGTVPEGRSPEKVYYRYYCVFCHGEKGDGHGPVGDSYMPVPADLRSARIRDNSDERLRRAMVAGIGHEPVLERVVPVRHRGYLVVYLRSLGEEGR